MKVGNIKGLRHPVAKIEGLKNLSFWQKLSFFILHYMVRLCESVRDTNLFGQKIFGLLNSPSIREVMVESH